MTFWHVTNRAWYGINRAAVGDDDRAGPTEVVRDGRGVRWSASTLRSCLVSTGCIWPFAGTQQE
jgi:hypothetical protein